jgi:hypothetical protein
VDCEKSCKEPIWEGDITSVLDQIAESATIEISDGDTSLQFVVDQPTTIATIQPRGLAPGDTLGDADVWIADLAPVSPMTPQEFQKDASRWAPRWVVLGFYQNGRFFEPRASTMTLQPEAGPWAFEAILFFAGQSGSGPVAGDATLIFSLDTNQLPFLSCPDDTTCTGGTERAMLEFPFVYQP